MDVDQREIELAKQEEGLRLVAYRDIRGIWTIGYGHTGDDVHEGLVWTEVQAEAALRKDFRDEVLAINRDVKVPLTQGEFDAVADLEYNVGVSAIEHSTLLRLLKAGKYAEAAAQFDLWDHAGGKVVAALLRRRQMETAMFVAGEGKPQA